VSSGVNLCPDGHVEGSAKPYIDAGRAAALLGVTRREVVDDVLQGCGVHEKVPGKLDALTGAVLAGGICVVDRTDLEGERLEHHRQRFASHSSGGAS
jgi:hypothetical protein